MTKANPCPTAQEQPSPVPKIPWKYDLEVDDVPGMDALDLGLATEAEWGAYTFLRDLFEFRDWCGDAVGDLDLSVPRPVLAKDIFAAAQEQKISKTTLCPMALRMGITKVKRKTGWWWVPPGVKEPTKWATRENPWAEAPVTPERAS